MFTRGTAMFVAAVVLMTASFAMAQSSDVFASAERLALVVEMEQDQAAIQRRRSGGLALTGGVLAAAGIVLALRPPVCEISSPTGAPRNFTDRNASIELREGLYQGKCDVEMTWTTASGHTRTYARGNVFQERLYLFRDYEAITKRTRNYVGWATAAAGGALVWFGLSSVEVPVRLDVAPTGGFRVSRSLGW